MQSASRRSILIGVVLKKQTKSRGKRRGTLDGGRKRALVVLFVPSVERDGKTAVDQPHLVDSALEMFGRVFGGATAYPKAKGIWRDEERGGALVKDEPVVVHCYTTPEFLRRRTSTPVIKAVVERGLLLFEDTSPVPLKPAAGKNPS